jgi:uncharacterized protein with GYD domain
MPTYITLIKFTEKGIQTIKDFQKHQAEAVKKAEGIGGKIKSLYMTMGEYDAVVIGECSNDEEVVAGAIAASMDGDIRTTTMRAFTPEEFAKIVGMLP